MTQLLLELGTAPHFSFDNLVVHEGNETAVSSARTVYLDGPPSFPPLFVHGPESSGKTHLLKALCSAFGARPDLTGASPIYLDSFDISEDCSVLTNPFHETNAPETVPRAVFLDDVHELPTPCVSAFWDVFNRSLRFGAPLIASSRRAVEDTFPDNEHVRSRLLSGLVLSLEHPHDNGRLMIMDKLARDRNIRVSQDVFRYLIARRSRSLKEMEDLIRTLDEHSLEMQRRITIPFIKMLEKEGFL